MHSSPPVLEFDQIRRQFSVGGTELMILKGVSFSVNSGELVSIMGASGSGKSTALNIMGLLDRPSAGIYRFEGEDTAPLSKAEASRLRGQKIGFVFQQFNLLDQMNLVDNVALPLAYRNIGRGDARERALARLAEVGLGDRGNHRPSELSGGQKQRVAIARALVGEPSVIFADEPTGALDSETSQHIMRLFIELNRGSGVTIVIITHDPNVARQCDRQLILRDGLLINDEH